MMIYFTGLSGSVHTISSLFTLPRTGLVSGILIAIFLYSGWDTAAYVGEEAKGKQAGSAAILSVVILFFIYSFVIFAFQGIAPFGTMGPTAPTSSPSWATRSVAASGRT